MTTILIKINIEPHVFEAAIRKKSSYECILYQWILKAYHQGNSIHDTVILIHRMQRICAIKKFNAHIKNKR